MENNHEPSKNEYELDPNQSIEEQLQDSIDDIAKKSLHDTINRPPDHGYTIENDPIHGVVTGTEEVQEGIKVLEKNEKDYKAKKEAAARANIKAEAPVEDFSFNEGATFYDEKDIKPVYGPAELAAAKKQLAPVGKIEFIGGNREKLQDVYDEAMEIRNRVKDPGNPRYRLMSVAAVELERIEQPADKTERIRKNNEEIAKAIKEAVGEEDKFSGDTGAGVQEFISEILIGGDAESVFIGTTGTIVSGNGQIGEKSDTYKNLVVLRWIKNNVNHVVAFSPREDAAIYTLVDGDMHEGWRRKFLLAGAIDCKERKEMDITNHDRDQFYVHEKTMEKIVDKIIKAETDIANSNSMSYEKSAIILESAADAMKHLAHLDKYMQPIGPQEDRNEMKSSEANAGDDSSENIG